MNFKFKLLSCEKRWMWNYRNVVTAAHNVDKSVSVRASNCFEKERQTMRKIVLINNLFELYSVFSLFQARVYI